METGEAWRLCFLRAKQSTYTQTCVFSVLTELTVVYTRLLWILLFLPVDVDAFNVESIPSIGCVALTSGASAVSVSRQHPSVV